MEYANATAPDFGVEDAPIDVDEIIFSMQWPEVPVHQMENDSQWWEQVPKENVGVFVKGEHSDAVERMFPDFCAQNRMRQAQNEKSSGGGGGFFGGKKKKVAEKAITTNAMNVTVTVKNPEGVKSLIYAINSAVFPGPAILNFRLEGDRDYEPARKEEETWKLLASVFRKCYPQFMSMEKIEITGHHIGDEALIFLALAVAHYPRLHTLDLWENKISGKGAIAFFKVIIQNKNIKTVNLGKNILDMNDKTALNQMAKDADIDCDTF